MSTWKVGDSWVTFGTGRTVGIGVGKMESQQEAFTKGQAQRVKKGSKIASDSRRRCARAA